MIYDFDESPYDDSIPLSIYSTLVMLVAIIITFPIILPFEIIILIFLEVKK